MVRQLTPTERALWNLEQPGARITSDLQAENNPRENLRVYAIRDRVWVARWRAQRKAGAA